MENRKIQVRERDKRENAATIEKAKPRYIKMDWGIAQLNTKGLSKPCINKHQHRFLKSHPIFFSHSLKLTYSEESERPSLWLFFLLFTLKNPKIKHFGWSHWPKNNTKTIRKQASLWGWSCGNLGNASLCLLSQKSYPKLAAFLCLLLPLLTPCNNHIYISSFSASSSSSSYPFSLLLYFLYLYFYYISFSLLGLGVLLSVVFFLSLPLWNPRVIAVLNAYQYPIQSRGFSLFFFFQFLGFFGFGSIMALVSAFLDIFRRPTIVEVLGELMMFITPLWIAVIVGVFVGWAWKPKWASLVGRDLLDCPISKQKESSSSSQTSSTCFGPIPSLSSLRFLLPSYLPWAADDRNQKEALSMPPTTNPDFRFVDFPMYFWPISQLGFT